MSWIGAGIGAGIGMLVGGPIGAGIGAAIGSAFGDDETQITCICPHCNKPVTIESEGEWVCPHCNQVFHYGDSNERQILFFMSLFSMLGKMAKADGIISDEEIAQVAAFIDEFGFDPEDKKAALTIFKQAQDDDTTIYDYAKQFSEIFDYEMCKMIYLMLWDVAMADGILHENEDLILRNIVAVLGIPDSQYQELKNEAFNTTLPNVNDCYKILGCTAQDTDQVIKQNYRKLVADYHPDKIQSKGLPEGFLKFANEQLQKINAAYQCVQNSRKNSN